MNIDTTFPSLKKLLNTEFHINYHDEKFELGRPGYGGPPHDDDLVKGIRIPWGFVEEIDFWDFEISLNGYTLNWKNRTK